MAVRFHLLQGDGFVSLDVKAGGFDHEDIQTALRRADDSDRAGRWMEAASILDYLGTRFMAEGDPEAAAYTYRRLLHVLKGKWSSEAARFSIKRPDVEVRMRDANAGHIAAMREGDVATILRVGRAFPRSFLWLAAKRPGELHDAIDVSTVRAGVSSRVFSGALFRQALRRLAAGPIREETGHLARIVVPHGAFACFGEFEPPSAPVLPPIEAAAGLPPAVIAGIYGAPITSLPIQMTTSLTSLPATA